MADYKGVLDELKLRRLALDAERANLDKAITAIEALIPTVNQSSRSVFGTTQVPGVTPRAFAGLTMPQAIEKCLRLAQQPQTKRQIQDALRAGGMRASAKSFSAHVYNTLHRLSKDGGPFRRESDGRWGLSEWPSNSENRGILGSTAPH